MKHEEELIIRAASTPEDFTRCLALRVAVFVQEQGVPLHAEEDAADHAPSTFHLMLESAGECLATGRLVEETRAGAICARIGRMAVRADERGQGLGSRIIRTLEEEARRRGIIRALLHAQTHALDFYRKLGYRETGPVFDEDGIPHIMMEKDLDEELGRS